MLTDIDGMQVNIETNGSIPLDVALEALQLPERVVFTMDWKSVSSNMSEEMRYENLEVLRRCDVLKLVVSNIKEIEQVYKILVDRVSSFKCNNVFVSPVFGEISLEDIADYLLHLPDVENEKTISRKFRMQVQLHKYIWEPSKRGV